MKLLGYEITFRKLRKRNRVPNKYGSKRWTEAETNTALRLRGENVPYEKIGKELNRTASAVQIRLSKVKRR